MDIEQFFLQEISATKMALNSLDRAEFGKACKLLEMTKIHHGRVWVAGNGGSAATASHFANDLWKMVGIQAFSLTDMTPTFMAYGNDEGWNEVFCNILQDHLEEYDVLVGISCSGNSKNIIKLMEINIDKIILTGDDGGSLGKKHLKPNAIIYARHPDIRIQENIHLIVCHMLAGALKND